ncbi:MAG: O-antigen ligase family protein [Sedimenticola sp.]
MNAVNLSSRLRERELWISLLIVAPILLLPVSKSAELPVLIMAVFGFFLVIQKPIALFNTPQAKYFGLLFLLIWIPVTFSLPDAVNLGPTTKVAWGYLRFFFAGIFIVYSVKDPKVREYLARSISAILILWIADALLQYLVGHDLFGIRLNESRLNGLFGEDLKLGQMTAVLAPILLIYFSGQSHLVRLPAWAGVIAVVLLSNSRASWVILAVVILGLFLHYALNNRKQALAWFSSAVLATALIGGILYSASESFGKRVDQTLLIFSGDLSDVDTALSMRLPIWQTALSMTEENPVNGIGARNFRHAYLDYAAEDDSFRSAGFTPTHPHQMLLEVGAETGMIGLVGLAIFLVLIARSFITSAAVGGLQTSAAICLFAAAFPINTHLAIYSSFWGMMLWWFAALHCGTIQSPDNSAKQEPGSP